MKNLESGFGRFFHASPTQAGNYLAGFLLASFCLLYLRPYYGIRHDSVLYLGQALLARERQQFANDLFFAYGSQSKYTFFPEIAAWLLGYFRPSEIFLALTLLGLLAFACASYALIRTLLPTAAQRFYALLAVLVLPTGYGGHLMFGYAEPFFSGRSIAEPLLLACLAAWLARRHWLAAACWAVAASIHPLQALALLALAFGMLVWQDRRWWHLLWLALPAIALGWLDLAPFNQLVTRHDPQWHQWIAERTPQVFVSSWEYAAWGSWLTDVFLGWLIVQHATGHLQRMARGAIIATVLGMLTTLVLADVLGLVLPTGLQPWRTQWLLHWLAMACVPMLLIRQRHADGRWHGSRALLLFAIVVYGVPMGAIAPSSLIALGLIPLYFIWPHLPGHVSPKFMHVLRYFPWAILLLGFIKYTQGIWKVYASMEGMREAARPEFMLVSYSLVSGIVLYAGIRLWNLQTRWRPMLIGILVIALVHAIGVWDRRIQWTKNIEAGQYSSDVFGVEISPASQVYWENELVAPWLVLNRPSFFNSQQSSGMAFNRGNAAEIVRRESLLGPLFMQSQICQLMNALNENEDCVVDDEQIKTICEKNTGPNYLVLTSRLATTPRGTWSITGGHKGNRDITYYLYQCTDFSGKVRSTAL